jgi:hypothetical protein
MSKEHKKRYLYLKSILRYFRLPVIIISGFTSVMAVGLQPYLPQKIISATTCLLSLSCGIIGSIELYLGIQNQMENELTTSKDYYLLSIEIYKILTLDRKNRNIEGKTFLDETYGTYVKLIENSNVLLRKIKDELTPLEKKYEMISMISMKDIKSNESNDSNADETNSDDIKINISTETE